MMNGILAYIAGKLGRSRSSNGGASIAISNWVDGCSSRREIVCMRQAAYWKGRLEFRSMKIPVYNETKWTLKHICSRAFILFFSNMRAVGMMAMSSALLLLSRVASYVRGLTLFICFKPIRITAVKKFK
jgi:hypothetical protein